MKVLNITVSQLRTSICLHFLYASALLSIFIVEVFDGMVGLIEGDGAGPKLLWTSRYPQDGVS